MEDFLLLLYAMFNSETVLGKFIIISYIAGITAVILVAVVEIILAVKERIRRH